MGVIRDIKDFYAFYKFRKTYKREFLSRDSKMNQYNILSNKLGNMLYIQLNCDQSDYINASYNEEEMIRKKMSPIIHYLSEELDFGEYLVPQVSNFVDENNNPTFSYGIIFIFMGYSLTLTKSIIYIIFFIILLIIGTILLCHFVL